MFHPFVCYLGVTLTFVLTFTLFGNSSLDPEKYFFIPTYLLIGYYTLASMLGDKKVYQKRTIKQVLFKSVCKYFFWGFILQYVIAFYSHHPAYKAMTPNTRIFIEHFFSVFVVCGLPYLILEEKFRYCGENVHADPYLKVAVLFKYLLRLDFGRFRRRLFTRRTRGMFLSAILRIHYLPIMVEQVHYGVTTLIRTGHNTQTFTLPVVILMMTLLAWLIDSNNASCGYFWQSNFTKTRFKEVDPYPFHWIIVLSCYPPFINFVTSYFAMFPSLPENSQRLISSSGVNTVIDIILLIALILYMISGCALAFACSNLSYKKIQTRGPYRFMRHPATTFKLIFFTIAFYRFREAFTWGWLVFFLFWIGIYVGRALVEERFLRRFPEYRAYMKQTKYRFIPGVV